jgi:prevent-host-death family protein
MSKRYSIAEARSNLPTIVDEAEAGLEIELTRRGKPVAVLVSPRQLERLRGGRPRFSDVYKAFLSKHSLADIDLENDFFESVRDKGVGRKVSV